MPKISVRPTESRKSNTPYDRPFRAWPKKSGTNTRQTEDRPGKAEAVLGLTGVRARLLRPGSERPVVRRVALPALRRSHADLRHARRRQPRPRVVLHARRLRRPGHHRGHRELLARAPRRAARGRCDRRRHGAARAAPTLRALAARPGAPDVRVHLPLRGRREVDLGWAHPLHSPSRSLLALGEDLRRDRAVLSPLRHLLPPRV